MAAVSQQVVPGLEAALTAAMLTECFPAASAWCEAQGAAVLEELADEDTFEELAAVLELKPLQKKRLLKVLKGSAAGASAESYVPTRDTVFVKNVFLGEKPSSGTETIGEEVDEEIQETDTSTGVDPDEDDAALEEQEEEGASSQSRGASKLFHTMTYDAYESLDTWSWVGGDPNTLDPVMENHAGAPASEAVVDGSQSAPVGAYEPGAQAVSMVMVPCDPSTYAYPISSGMCFPGCVAVPVSRFDAWPGIHEGMPVPETQYAVPGAEVTSDTPPPRPQVMQTAFSVASSIYRVRWTVDARKLKSTDREMVSPSFDLSFAGGQVQFKMVMRPIAVSEGRGGASFKRAKGKGTVELRCLSEVSPSMKPVVIFQIAVGSSISKAKQFPPRGPVKHDFTQKPIVGLPEGSEQWEFGKAVDEATQTFVVSLEILSGVIS